MLCEYNDSEFYCVVLKCNCVYLNPHIFSTLIDISRPNARIMLHQPSGGAQGMAADIEM